MSISTHILDTAKGSPARDVRVILEHLADDGTWAHAGEGLTDEKGRIAKLQTGEGIEAGSFRIRFLTSGEFFHPEILVSFRITDPSQHYHVPLLLSPYGYTTYRGS
jgi:5-hydroxyisourate hydrolase